MTTPMTTRGPMPTIRIIGRTSKPPAKPSPPKAKPRPRRRGGVPAPASPPLPHPEAEPLTYNRVGAGQAKFENMYVNQRTCQCERPMVFRDPDTRTGSERLAPRCQNCGKPVR